MSRRLQIRDAIVAALNTDTPSDIPAATTRRWVPGIPLTEPLISVFFSVEPVAAPVTRNFGVAVRSLSVVVQCIVPVESEALTDDAVEPMLNWAVRTLGLNTLGGLVHSIREERTDWTPLKADLIYMVAAVTFAMDYQTKRDDMDAEA